METRASDGAARVRVMIVDDHPLFVRGISDLLAETDDLQVVAQAARGEEAVALARRWSPDVVIMDVHLPDMSGIEAAKRIAQDHSGQVVMISAVVDGDDISRAIEAGSRSYVSKDAPPETILEAVRQVAQGNAYLPPLIAKEVIARLNNANQEARPSRRLNLSERELAILRAMSAGKKNRLVAAELGISERTVGNHITSIYNKLGVSDRASAVLTALREGIIELESHG